MFLWSRCAGRLPPCLHKPLVLSTSTLRSQTTLAKLRETLRCSGSSVHLHTEGPAGFRISEKLAHATDTARSLEDLHQRLREQVAAQEHQMKLLDDLRSLLIRSAYAEARMQTLNVELEAAMAKETWTADIQRLTERKHELLVASKLMSGKPVSASVAFVAPMESQGDAAAARLVGEPHVPDSQQQEAALADLAAIEVQLKEMHARGEQLKPVIRQVGVVKDDQRSCLEGLESLCRDIELKKKDLDVIHGQSYSAGLVDAVGVLFEIEEVREKAKHAKSQLLDTDNKLKQLVNSGSTGQNIPIWLQAALGLASLAIGVNQALAANRRAEAANQQANAAIQQSDAYKVQAAAAKVMKPFHPQTITIFEPPVERSVFQDNLKMRMESWKQGSATILCGQYGSGMSFGLERLLAGTQGWVAVIIDARRVQRDHIPA